METFLIQMAAPFFLVAMLAVAYPVKKRVQRMKDGKLKRFLLISWN